MRYLIWLGETRQASDAKDMGAPMALEDPAIYGFAPAPTTASLRKLIDAVLPTDSALEAFCIDYFPRVQQRFSDSMERRVKTSLLLEQENRARILSVMEMYDREAVDKNRHLIRLAYVPEGTLDFSSEETTQSNERRKRFSLQSFLDTHPMLMFWMWSAVFTALTTLISKFSH